MPPDAIATRPREYLGPSNGADARPNRPGRHARPGASPPRRRPNAPGTPAMTSSHHPCTFFGTGTVTSGLSAAAVSSSTVARPWRSSVASCARARPAASAARWRRVARSWRPSSAPRPTAPGRLTLSASATAPPSPASAAATPAPSSPPPQSGSSPTAPPGRPTPPPLWRPCRDRPHPHRGRRPPPGRMGERRDLLVRRPWRRARVLRAARLVEAGLLPLDGPIASRRGLGPSPRASSRSRRRPSATTLRRHCRDRHPHPRRRPGRRRHRPCSGSRGPVPLARGHLALRPAGPGGRGVTRYTTVEATPAGASWAVTVTCGTHEARTGRILTRHVGQGTSGRGRGSGLGGTYLVEGVRQNFIITLKGAELDLPGQFTDARCASGIGQLSTGD